MMSLIEVMAKNIKLEAEKEFQDAKFENKRGWINKRKV